MPLKQNLVKSNFRTKRYLNRILFEWNELSKEEIKNYKSDNDLLKITLPEEDYRYQHIANILKLQTNDTLRVGIVDNSEDLNNIMSNDSKIQWDHKEQTKKLHIHIPNTFSSITLPKTKHGVSLLIALPRPLQLKRILPMISQYGVDEIILIGAKKVPLDYFGSHLLRTPTEIRELLKEGLSQAGNDVTIPNVHIFKYLRNYIKYDLDKMFPLEDYTRILAHPNSSRQTMKDVLEQKTHRNKNVLIAIGPEGGWTEDSELPLFVENGFECISLGDRILRTDVAIVSLLALAYDCTRSS